MNTQCVNRHVHIVYTQKYTHKYTEVHTMCADKYTEVHTMCTDKYTEVHMMFTHKFTEVRTMCEQTSTLSIKKCLETVSLCLYSSALDLKQTNSFFGRNWKWAKLIFLHSSNEMGLWLFYHIHCQHVFLWFFFFFTCFRNFMWIKSCVEGAYWSPPQLVRLFRALEPDNPWNQKRWQGFC